MDALTADQIDLDALPKAEQRLLFDRLAARFDKGPAPVKAGHNEQELYDVLRALLAEHGIRPAPYAEFARQYGVGRFAEKALFVNSLLDRGIGGLIRKPQRLQLLRVCMECLIELLIEWGLPLGMQPILNNIGALEAAIERSYPGYLRARLLDRVARLG